MAQPPRKPKPKPERKPDPTPLGNAQPTASSPPSAPPMPHVLQPPPLAKIDDVARHVRASRATVERLVADGTLSTGNGAVVRVGKLLRFDLARVLDALRNAKPAA